MPRRYKTLTLEELERGLENGTIEIASVRYSVEFSEIGRSMLVSVPLILWIFSILHRVVAQSAQDYDCESLLNEKHFVEAAIAMSVTFALFFVYLRLTLRKRYWIATLGLSVVLLASFGILVNFPNLDHKSTFGLFHSPSPMLHANINGNYTWGSNIKTCICQTEACEDLVYRSYFQSVYRGDFSGYTKLSTKDEPERGRPSADELSRTSLKNGDNEVGKDKSSPGTISNGKHHKVCYQTNFVDEVYETLCYECNGCEEKFLRDAQKSRWRLGNGLFAMFVLLNLANLIVSVAERWGQKRTNLNHIRQYGSNC